LLVSTDNPGGEGSHLGNLGLAYIVLGDAKKAIEYYEQALKINPKDANACYNKACACSLMDKKNEALADLKRAVELDPDYKEMAKNDNDFEKLWEERDFKNIVTAD
jgi:tetratricopeptide (TPR) repeat protein